MSQPAPAVPPLWHPDAPSTVVQGDNLAVLADLPGGPAALSDAGIELVLNVAFGHVRRTGQWPVPELVRIAGTGQRTVLDLTGAHLERSEVVIEVAASMTSTAVLLPWYAEVDTDGLELVIDCVGTPDSLTQALQVVAPGGRILVVGMPGHTTLDLTSLWHRESSIAGCYAYTRADFERLGASVPACTISSIAS